MADTPNKSIFSRLDTSLMRSTKSVSIPGTQEPRKEETQEPRNLSSQLPRNPGTQEDRKEASQEPSKTGAQELGKRADYPQQTFNIHPDVIDMLEDMKRDLRRQHSIKTSKEILAEEAIRLLCIDFQQKRNNSQIVHILHKTPGTQENGKPGNK